MNRKMIVTTATIGPPIEADCVSCGEKWDTDPTPAELAAHLQEPGVHIILTRAIAQDVMMLGRDVWVGTADVPDDGAAGGEPS